MSSFTAEERKLYAYTPGRMLITLLVIWTFTPCIHTCVSMECSLSVIHSGLRKNFTHEIDAYFGIIKASVLSPQHLFLLLLPRSPVESKCLHCIEHVSYHGVSLCVHTLKNRGPSLVHSHPTNFIRWFLWVKKSWKFVTSGIIINVRSTTTWKIIQVIFFFFLDSSTRF